MKTKQAHSWIWHVCNLLKKYSLPIVFELLHYQLDKVEWKKAVKKAVLTLWEDTLKREASSMPTRSHLNHHA